jgi:RNA-binding protein
MIHNIRYRLFVYEDEDEEELIQALKNLLPTAKPGRDIAEGMFEDEIIILSGIIDKKRETKEFLKKILDLDKEVLDKLSDDFERKVDKNGNLFLRFSKDAACENTVEVCDTGDSIHLKVKIAAYPAKKEVAIDLLNEFLKDSQLL